MRERPSQTMKRQLLKSTVFWLAATICGLFIATMVLSERWSVLYVPSDDPFWRMSSVELRPQHIKFSWFVGDSYFYSGRGPPPPGVYINGAYCYREWGVHLVDSSNFFFRALTIPCWLPAILAGALAFFTRPTHRPIQGQCRCGYSRHGLAPTAPCPECGHPSDRLPLCPSGEEPSLP